MNEPFAGNVFEEGHLKILPGISGEENLVPFYDIIQNIFGCGIFRLHIVREIILLDIILPIKCTDRASRNFAIYV